MLEHRSANDRVLVVLHQPYSDPHGIEGEDGVRFLNVTDESCTMRGLNRALAQVETPFVHLLASGTSVTEGWTEVACAQFQDSEVAVVAPHILDFDNPRRAIGLGVVYRHGGYLQLLHSAYVFDEHVRVAPHASASFYRREALEAIGGFDSSLSLRLAGVDASMAMAEIGWRVAMEPNCRILARRIATASQTVFQRTREAERLFWRWADFGGLTRSLFSHFQRVMAESWSYFPSPRMVQQIAGRVAGLRAIGTHRLRREQLEMARIATRSEDVEDTATGEFSMPFPSDQSGEHSTRPRAAA